MGLITTIAQTQKMKDKKCYSIHKSQPKAFFSSTMDYISISHGPGRKQVAKLKRF